MTTEVRSALREEQAELTRSRILDAIVRIVATDVTGLSVEAVAREAEVSRPTVYRYFRNKREMVDGVLDRYAERVGTAATVSATSLDEVLDQVPAIFAHWEALEPELRAAAAALHRAEERARFLPERLTAVRRLLEPYSSDLSKADRERLARVAVILFSSGMADVLHRYLGASATEAADLVVWAVNRLVRTEKDRAMNATWQPPSGGRWEQHAQHIPDPFPPEIPDVPDPLAEPRPTTTGRKDVDADDTGH